MFSGSITALVTPFKNGIIDYESLNRIIDFQVEGGTSALVVAGTTGEASTLSEREHIALIGHCVNYADGRIPIIGGASSNSTSEAVSLTKSIEANGAAGTLHATGYYVNPNIQQIIGHYTAVNEHATKPIVLYNIPSRTGIDIGVQATIRISELCNVKAIKDSTGIISRVSELSVSVKDDFNFLSGDDGSALGYISQGGDGSISVISNIAPRLHAQLIGHALRGEIHDARKIFMKLLPIVKAIFLEPNPCGVKYAMSLLGMCSSETRSPLLEPTPATKKQIYITLKNADLMK